MNVHLLDCFEKTAIEYSSKIAVKHNAQSISFEELRDKSIRLGSAIVDMVKGRSNTPVAVFLPKEIATVIADIGIMYSSNPFMNLDVKTPKERIINILNLIHPAAIITGSSLKNSLRGLNFPKFSLTSWILILFPQMFLN